MNNVFESCNSPEEYVLCMYDNTDKETGMLIFHGNEHMYETGDETYRFHMNWNRDDVDQLIFEHRTLVNNLKTLADISSAHSGEDIGDFIKDEGLKNVWRIYLIDFTDDGAATDEIKSIDEKNDSIEIANEIRRKMENGEEITDGEKDLYEECKDVALTEEEEKIMNRFWSARIEEAEKRIGKSKFAYNALIYPKRIFALMKLGAPEVVINKEIVQLIIAMALHKSCDSREEL